VGPNIQGGVSHSDFLGRSISISGNGSRIITGAPGNFGKAIAYEIDTARSITNLNLTLNEVLINNLQQICQGDEVVVGNNTYNEVGVYYDSYTTEEGCDGTIVTTLSYKPTGCTDPLAQNYTHYIDCDDGGCIYPVFSSTEVTACDYYEWYSNSYYQSTTEDTIYSVDVELDQLGYDLEGEFEGGKFGSSVSLSFNGNRLAVGANNNDIMVRIQVRL